MKKYFIRFLYISIILFLVFSMTDTSAKKENITKYTTLQKENQIIKQEIIEETVQEKTVQEETVQEEKVQKQEHKKETHKKETKGINTDIKEENIDSTNVSTNNIEVQTNTNSNTDNTKYGTFGRLYISGHSVALYDYNVNTKSSIDLQKIVDNKDSAAYYRNHRKLVIADHYNQGFKVLIDLSEGTTSYIKFENGDVINYKLVKKFKGYNDEYDLKDLDGNSVFDMSSDIIMYTCYDNGIMVTLWSLS